ncbi:retrovirus-related Pol polyprotein from transposon 297 [Trichonephila clavipes]|nr:retrovirus-related Pol polyprotein from transposon 297 [Trichonephila clavipes]
MWRFEIRKTLFNYWRCYVSVRKDIRAKQCGVRGIVIMLKDEVGMSVRSLMLMIVRKIGGIWKFCLDRVKAEMIIGVTTRMAVKEINVPTAGIDFRGMIEDLTIDDTNLEMGVKMTILVEGTAEIEVRDDQDQQKQSENEVPIKLSAICRTPVELPYVPILLNDTFTNALWDTDKPGLTHFLYHEIDTGDKTRIVSRPYRYDRVKQEILDYHVEKMLKEGTIILIQSPYASPVVLCKKYGLPPDNPEAYRFVVDYRKLNSITKYPRYPLPLIDDLITNIPQMTIMSSLDLKSGYFQLTIYPSDIIKTTFVTKNGTYAFWRMPFSLSGAASNFQKAIDLILKLVIGKFVSVYMDDVIISSSSFTHHVEHLREVFRLLQDAGLNLNKEKCKFGCDELKY